MEYKYTLKTICQGTLAYIIHLGMLRRRLLKHRAMLEATVKARLQCGCFFTALNSLRRNDSLVVIHLLKKKKKRTAKVFIYREEI